MAERRPAAPPVVAVLVTHDAGAWFDQTLASVAEQDYPNLTTVVIDAGSAVDPTARVHALLPSAYVRRLDANPGVAAAANEVLQLVEGAAFFLFLHDDVALDPSATRLLVEEAFRSNAAVAGPKLVAWDDPGRLLQVGMGADRTGETLPLAERGELDQEQHDALADVFCVPGGVMLVRADLFAALGGFDGAIEAVGEDLDLCWRAHLAGARVMVVPAARARHLEALAERRPDVPVERWRRRHAVRTALACTGRWHLPRTIVQMAVTGLLQVVVAAVTLHFRRAGDVVHAWTWNLARLGELRRKRRAAQAIRAVPDGEIRPLQVRGSAALAAFVRGQAQRNEDRLAGLSSWSATGRSMLDALRSGTRRASIGLWIVLVAWFAVGSRGLLTGVLPRFGEQLAFGSSPLDLLRSYASGWHAAGVGSDAPVPTLVALAGLAGLAGLARMELVRTVAMVGPLLVGWIGLWRLTRPLGSQRARLAGTVTYALLPLPYNALASGRWSALVAYGALPFALARLARLARLAPWGDVGGEPGPGVPRRSFVAGVCGLGLVVAVAAAASPAFPLLVVGSALALVVAGVLVGSPGAAVRSLAGALAAAGVAALLHLPWALVAWRPGSAWVELVGVAGTWGRGGTAGLAELLRFDTGPVGTVATFAVAMAAAVGLLVGRSWRWAWAARGWVLAVVAWAVAWGFERGTIGVASPGGEVLLVPAAAGVALAAAAGAAAFDLDVEGTRFSWRQVVSVLAPVALAVAAVPAFAPGLDGRWDQPAIDFARPLAFTADTSSGAARTLWLGDPALLPAKGWAVTPAVAFTLTEGVPDVRWSWTGPPTRGTELVGEAVRLAANGDTARLGRLLAPMAVRWVIVPSAQAPAATGATRSPADPGLLAALGSQLDLRRVAVDEAVVVYENTAWLPGRALLSPGAAAASREAGFATLATTELGRSSAVLPERSPPWTASGPLVPGEVFASESSDAGWRLQVDGQVQQRRPAFGWANAWTVATPGRAELTYRTPLARWVLLGIQVLAWLLVLRIVVAAVGREAADRRRRERRAMRRAPATPLVTSPPIVLAPVDLPWAEGPGTDEPEPADVRAGAGADPVPAARVDPGPEPDRPGTVLDPERALDPDAPLVLPWADEPEGPAVSEPADGGTER